MKFLSKLRIGRRLGLGFALVLAMLLVIAGTGVNGVTTVNDDLKMVYEDRMVPLERISEVNSLVLRNRILVMDMMAFPDPANIEKRDQELKANIESASAAWKRFTESSLTEEEKRLAQRFADIRKTYVHDGLLPVRDAVRAGKMEEARHLYQEALAPAAREVSKLLGELVADEIAEGRKEFEHAQHAQSMLIKVTIAIAAAALLAGAVVAWLITRSITHPMAVAIGVADRIRDGDLTQPVHVEGGDETAQLLAAMRDMQARLATTVSDIRNGADHVSSASVQIAQGNRDLSSRTEQQASSLEETAASMEQMTATVRNNSEAAQQASQLSVNASQVAAKGGTVVSQVVQTMGEIQSASRKIADIINVIDGIAFQTNILALNAAVEAARAGEQGRGFAVVAGEVRSLAQRSAQAAREIKSLITDSVERVDTGSKLVDNAGATMAEIVTQVQRVSDLIGEITAATMEQNAGIGQVGQAVSQLDEMTQQNAALVEQSSAAADSLRQQAAKLAGAVSVFRTEIA